MTSSIFFKFLARVMMPVLIIFSIALLLRGHNHPGGGFVGGLVAASGIILVTLADGPEVVRSRLRIDFLRSTQFGLIISFVAGMIGLVFEGNFLTSIYYEIASENLGTLSLSTTLLFDIGVYLVVFSITSAIVMGMAEEGRRGEH
jgi:multisubunit Na+/H+ antiporter MnhB subunit